MLELYSVAPGTGVLKPVDMSVTTVWERHISQQFPLFCIRARGQCLLPSVSTLAAAWKLAIFTHMGSALTELKYQTR